MANLTNETMNKTNGMAHDVRSKAQGAERQLERMSNQAGERIGEWASTIANSATEYAKVSRDYVQENPVKSVAIAAATGIVVGSLFTLAMRKN